MKIPQFIRYCIVGGFGAGVQTAIFYALTRWLGVPDFISLGGIALPWALAIAILAALASNFSFNKRWTFGDK
ncbi:MAG: GtrA family protein [Nitrososphaerales archaeon]